MLSISLLALLGAKSIDCCFSQFVRSGDFLLPAEACATAAPGHRCWGHKYMRSSDIRFKVSVNLFLLLAVLFIILIATEPGEVCREA